MPSHQSKERALVGEVVSTVALADQISREFNVATMEIEFTDDTRETMGAKVYSVSTLLADIKPEPMPRYVARK